MKKLSIISLVGFIAASGLGAAQAQPNSIQGTPESHFPYARPHEVQMINGVPCRTIYDRQIHARVPVACAGDVSVHMVR